MRGDGALVCCDHDLFAEKSYHTVATGSKFGLRYGLSTIRYSVVRYIKAACITVVSFASRTESHGEQRHHPIERLARAAQGDERAVEVVRRGGSTVAVDAAHLRESE